MAGPSAPKRKPLPDWFTAAVAAEEYGRPAVSLALPYCSRFWAPWQGTPRSGSECFQMSR